MQPLFEDSIEIVQHLGKPSLFITFTTNPGWKDIQDELLPHQVTRDCPDLSSRVFYFK